MFSVLVEKLNNLYCLLMFKLRNEFIGAGVSLNIYSLLRFIQFNFIY